MEKKTKILFRLRSLEMGGVVKVLIDILKHLPQDQLDITLMVNLFQGELRNEIPSNIKIIKIAKGKEDFSENPLLLKIQLAFRLLKLNLLNQFPFLMKFYYKEKYDVEIAFGRSELEMVLRSPQKKSKKVAWVHWEFSHRPEYNRSEYLVEQLQKFDHVIFCSENVRQQVKDLYGIDLKSTSVIHNVIHFDKIRKLSEEIPDDLPKFNEKLFTFVSVGRVQDNKGYPLLLELHQQLLNRGLKYRIIIIGDGNKMSLLKERIEERNLNESFVLLGKKANPFPYMKNADCFILPTQSEAYPLSVKEALLLGLPVLVTDVGGVNEIVSDGIDGVLMKFDEEDILEKIERIIRNPELLNRLKSGADKSKYKFETIEVYKRLEQELINISKNE